ncbi:MULTISPECIES: hypothetical protein [unclassified Sphingomonas]|uniref:hypothetical protein n=1 Tax=unclassified Sphingomonas TaxID=196159 RepID=UPI0012E3E82C|nr:MULTISPECIES: hypothetical protein [unclassified Sphingomonas]
MQSYLYLWKLPSRFAAPSARCIAQSQVRDKAKHSIRRKNNMRYFESAASAIIAIAAQALAIGVVVAL